MIPTEVEVENTHIKASQWVKRGNMIVQRSALDCTDPDSYWCLWYARFKEILPEDLQIKIFGYTLCPSRTQEILNRLQKIKHQPIYMRK